jgi:hypothetical protein
MNRDRSAMQFAITVTRGIEAEYPELAGIREGEATSDVLAAILVRLERDAGAVEALQNLGDPAWAHGAGAASMAEYARRELRALGIEPRGGQ